MYINEDSLKSELSRAAGGKVTMIDKQKANILKDMASKIVGIDLQNSIFSTLRFPSLPRNWKFLMSPIKWPEKAAPNPNASLFADPLIIDKDDAMDIGMQCFGGNRFGGKKTGLKMTLNPMAYINKKPTTEDVDFGVSLFKMLLEDTSSQTGADIETGDVKSNNTNAAKASQDIVNAISTYVASSIQAVKPVVEMVAGGANVNTFVKAVQTANQSSMENVAEWLAQTNAAFQETGQNWLKRSAENARTQRDCIKDALTFALCISVQEKIPSGYTKDEFVNAVYRDAQVCTSRHALRSFMKKYTKRFNGDFDEFSQEFDSNGSKPFEIPLNGTKFASASSSVSASAEVNPQNGALNEYEDPMDMDKPLTDGGPIDYDRLYRDLFNQLSSAMSEVIGPRDSWSCFKRIEDEMKFLKDSADKEINAKIELVCKTGAGTHSLLKYPFKAEGLKGMWARYSAELQQRINNRIAQLKGSHGGPETGSAAMVEDFLRVTYPQIIAMMLTYRCIFEQMKAVYKDGKDVACTLEEVKAGAKAVASSMEDDVTVIVHDYDSLT